MLSNKSNTMNAKPFVKWAGGKTQLLSEIRRKYPERIEKVSLPRWASLLILLLLTMVTVIIVTFQSAKTVYSNPIEGLKKE